jgi:putative transposase
LPTLRELPDDLWERLEYLINRFDPPKPTGRKRADARRILNGIIFRIRSGCQWNHLPTVYGDEATIHRTFQRRVGSQLFELIWSQLVAECQHLGLVQWEWQAADGWLGKARSGGDELGPNPTDRAKNGTKKSLLVDGDGGPLAIVVAPANVTGHLLLEETIEAIVVERPRPTRRAPPHLCLDGGFNNEPSREVVAASDYVAHIRPGGLEEPPPPDPPRHPARRRVVERTLAWLSKCRGLLSRYEKKRENYLGLLQFACALLWYRRESDPALVFS